MAVTVAHNQSCDCEHALVDFIMHVGENMTICYGTGSKEAGCGDCSAEGEQTGRIHTEETKATHDKQVAALKLANDMLQQQLARMAESVPAMLR